MRFYRFTIYCRLKFYYPITIIIGDIVNTREQDSYQQCDVCDYEAQGKTFEICMEALKPYYVEKHHDFTNHKMKPLIRAVLREVGSLGSWNTEPYLKNNLWKSIQNSGAPRPYSRDSF